MSTTELQAGRELDRLVHERVWAQCAHRNRRKAVCSQGPTEVCEDCGEDAWWGEKSVPWYSANMTNAWRVVEHMRTQGWLFTLADSSEPGQWYARFHRLNRLNAAVRETAPLAICRAALAATEVAA
jgi:hypothetical protein